MPVKDQFIRQGSRLCADIAAATRPVVDNKLLAEPGDEGEDANERRHFLHLAAGAAALPVVSRIARRKPIRRGQSG